ncbi:MAG: patatin-like phospholipase family protein [Pseudomonadota bacterium]
MKDDVRRSELTELLHQIDGFSALAPDILDQMTDTAEYRDVARGAVLIHEGEPADTLYIVLRGRFMVLAGGRTIAEIAMGEPIGELAFFAGGMRTATVVAARDSLVMCLTRTAYDHLTLRTPALANGILAAVSQRLARAIPASPQLRPAAGQVCAVFPGAGQVLSPAFVTGLTRAFGDAEGWHVMQPGACPDAAASAPRALARWLDGQESAKGKLLLVCPDPEAHPIWAQVTANNCDSIVLAVARGATFDVAQAPSALEHRIFDATLPAHLHLALYRDAASDTTSGTKDWLRDRPVGLHHHLSLDSTVDFARLGRFIRGEAVGLVMCGGGSFGTAHLGVIKSLQEHAYSFDFVGGTSVGSAMAAALSIGLSPDDIMEQCEDIFLRSKAMSRLTVPRYALLDHHRLDAAFKKHYGVYDVEDLPINFYAVSTSLTHNDVSVIRTGPLWQAIRASTAIPGIFPPFLRDDGEVLIDGGLIDNVPIDAMRDLKPGPNVVLNFLPGKPWVVRAKYDAFPTRTEALAGLLRKPKGEGEQHPTAFAVLARAMVVNARKLLRNIDIGDDILMNVAVLRQLNSMDWKSGRELFDTAYEHMSDALKDSPARPGLHPFDRLRDAAVLINAMSDAEADMPPKAPPQPRRSTITDPTE